MIQMTLVDVLSQLPELVLAFVDDPPEDEDVTAGWVGFAVFLALCAAVVFLGFSLVKQLRKAQQAKDAGVYGDDPALPTRTEPTGTEPSGTEPEEPDPA